MSFNIGVYLILNQIKNNNLLKFDVFYWDESRRYLVLQQLASMARKTFARVRIKSESALWYTDGIPEEFTKVED